jgi:hypothetical protein
MKWVERPIVSNEVRVFDTRWGWRDGDGVSIEVYKEHFEMDILCGMGMSQIVVHIVDYSAFPFYETDFLNQTFAIAEHIAKFFGAEEWPDIGLNQIEQSGTLMTRK